MVPKALVRKVIRMKKRRLFKGVVLVLAAAVIAGGVLHFYPAWRAANKLEENLDFRDFSYRLEVELKKEELDSAQHRVMGILAELPGVEEGAR